MTEKLKKLILWLLHHFKRFISYGLVGIINTLVDYGVFTLLHAALSVAAGISQVAGYMCGSVCGYILNSNITFREGKGRTRAQFLQYFCVDIALGLVSGLAMDWAEGVGINAYLAKVVLTIVIMLLHYIIYKHLVFRIKKEDEQ